jgi:hypothetical protein
MRATFALPTLSYQQQHDEKGLPVLTGIVQGGITVIVTNGDIRPFPHQKLGNLGTVLPLLPGGEMKRGVPGGQTGKGS